MSFEEWWPANRHLLWIMASDNDAKEIWDAAYSAGVAAERERCAKVAEGNAESQRNLALGMDSADIVAFRIAAAIRGGE